MPKIWRVENENGLGPYRDIGEEIFYDSFLADHNGDINNHPGPKYDKGILRHAKKNEICGFLNMEQVKQWFTKRQLKFLEEHGYYLREKEVKEITAIGKFQVLATI